MFQLPTSSLPIPQIISMGFNLWKIGFKRVQFLALLFTIWVFIPYFLVAKLNAYNPLSFEYKTVEKIILTVLYVLVVLLLYAAVYYRTANVMFGQTGSFFGAFRVGAKKMLVLVPAFIISAVILGCGYVLLIIPGIYLTVAFAFYFPLIVVDDLGPIAALKQSYQLIQRNWWRSAAIVFVPTILFGMIAMLIELFTIGLVLSLQIGIFTFSNPASNEVWILHNVLKMILTALYFPFYAALILTQLHNLKLFHQENAAKVQVPSEPIPISTNG